MLFDSDHAPFEVVWFLDAARPGVGRSAASRQSAIRRPSPLVVAGPRHGPVALVSVGPARARGRVAGAPLPGGPGELWPPLFYPFGRQPRPRPGAPGRRRGLPKRTPRPARRAVCLRATARRQLHAVLSLERVDLLGDSGRSPRARLPPRSRGASAPRGAARNPAERPPRAGR